MQKNLLKKNITLSQSRFGNYKLNTILLLQNLGLSKKKIINSLKIYKKFNNSIKSTSKKPIKKEKTSFLKKLKLTEKIKLKEIIIGKIGRTKLNKKLYKKLWWKNEEYLKIEDILGCLKYLINNNKEYD